MPYKLVFDTNILRKEDFAEVANLSEFLLANPKAREVGLYVPEIALEEWKQFRKRVIRESQNKAENALKALMKLGHKEVKIEKIDEEAFVENETKEKIQKFSLQIIPIPILNQAELISRAILKKSPFNTANEGSDYGFKDTLIFLSLKKDAKKNQPGQTSYIFLTNDGGYLPELIKEFKEDTGQELIVLKDISTVKDQLDERLNLGLKRSQKREEIEKIIRENSEKFDIFLLKEERNNNFVSFGHGEEIDGYNFSSFYIEDFRESKKNYFTVSVRIVANILYQKAQKPSSVTWGEYLNEREFYQPANVVGISSTASTYAYSPGSSLMKPQQQSFWLTLIVNTEKREIKIST